LNENATLNVEQTVNVEQEVIKTLHAVLSLVPGKVSLCESSPLLGSVPELDSMAVVSILAAFEDRFGFLIDDDEVDGRTFATVGSLTAFVQSKLDR
jgi:acyl carrier protein